jgi:hypothetical protein
VRLGGEPAITNRSISTWENGRGLDFGWLPELAAALDCTVTYLLGMTDDPQRWEPASGAAASARAERARTAPTAPDATRTPEPDDPSETAGSAAAHAPAPTDVACHWILGPGPIPPVGDRSASSDRKPE